MLKRLFYISATLLLLVTTYTIAAHRAQAQAGGTIAGFSAELVGGAGVISYVMSPNGDLYSRRIVDGDTHFEPSPAHYIGNIWGSGTVTVQPETWTGVKEKYRK